MTQSTVAKNNPQLIILHIFAWDSVLGAFRQLPDAATVIPEQNA